MWSRISGGRYGFDVAVSVQNLKPPFLALVHCPSVTFDVYQLAYGQAVALFGGSAREWVWKGVLDAGGNGDSAFNGTHAERVSLRFRRRSSRGRSGVLRGSPT